MKTITILSVFALCNYFSFAQTLVLQPDSSGKDANIFYLTTQTGPFGATNDNPIPDTESFHTMEWTWNGSAGTIKGLLDFDLTALPANIAITSAQLSLYAFPASVDGGHSSLSGSNEAHLSEITSPWDENTVTWNTQPTTNPNGQIVLAQSIDENEDYLDIDVTAIIQNKWANPTLSHGFMLSMVSQDYYRSMIFGSSDNVDPNLRPKLVITYTRTSGIAEQEDISFSMYPNPTQDLFYLELEEEFSFSVTDVMGREVISESVVQEGSAEIDLREFDSGSYYVTVLVGDREVTKVIQKL